MSFRYVYCGGHFSHDGDFASKTGLDEKTRLAFPQVVRRLDKDQGMNLAREFCVAVNSSIDDWPLWFENGYVAVETGNRQAISWIWKMVCL